jgi:TatD DNase family protein
MYIDLHCHLVPDEPDVLRLRNIYAQEAFRTNIEQTKYYSIGLHPWDIPLVDAGNAMVWIREYAPYRQFIAVGETGMDKLKVPDMDNQVSIFEAHLDIAESLGKPVLIHCVRSHQELAHCRRKRKNPTPWVIHGFTSNPQIATDMLKLGIRLSYGGALLSNNSNAEKVFSEIPLDMAFLETDDSSVSIRDVYEKASKIRGISVEDMKTAMMDNFKKVFLPHE